MEILIILVIALIIFGAGKLPEIGSGIGSAIKNFKTGVAEVEIEEKEKPEKIEAAPHYFSHLSPRSQR